MGVNHHKTHLWICRRRSSRYRHGIILLLFFESAHYVEVGPEDGEEVADEGEGGEQAD